MAAQAPRNIRLPVFGGQGTLSFDPDNARKQLRRYTAFPSGAVLVASCYAAFHAELDGLTADYLQKVDICALDFKEKVTLFCPLREEYLRNPVISGTTLLLVQALQYLTFIEESHGFSENPTAFLNTVQLNASNGVGVLGFSSGILAACVTAASRTAVAFIAHTVEAYRLAFWIGVRSQLFCATLNGSSPFQGCRPWVMVLLFVDKIDIQTRVQSFNKVRFYVSLTCILLNDTP